MRQETAYTIIALCCVLITGLLAVLVYQNWRLRSQPDLTTPFQTVQMANGQVFFGRLEGAGSAYPRLREVYQLQSRTNPETKQVTTTVIKRSQEWEGADTMYLNAAQIMAIDAIKPESNLDKLLQQSRSATVAPAK